MPDASGCDGTYRMGRCRSSTLADVFERLRRTLRSLGSKTDERPRLVWMNCPVCRRQVEVPKAGQAYYPEELIAACRKQNGTTCGPFYDYVKDPLSL